MTNANLDPASRVQVSRRLVWLVLAAVAWALAIFGKLFSLQVLRHNFYARLAHSQQERRFDIPAPRGAIFDRNRRPLAMSVRVKSVFVNPLRIPDLMVASELLSGILDLNRDELYGRMKWAFDNRRGFLWVKKKISATEEERLRSLRLEWIEFQTGTQRHYPKGALAAHVLGSVDHRQKGNAGIEQSLEREICGAAGYELLLTDVRRRPIESEPGQKPREGTDLTLTIDERIQFVAERELKNAVIANRARYGSAIVMNPYNGEILALANYPSFDPNLPPERGENRFARFNLGVSVPFEPGSIFKVVTLSAALETTSLRPESLINCGNGTLKLPGRVIHEAKHGYGTIPLSMVLQKSSNIGAIMIGTRVGQQKLYEYVRRFGFGSATGIPLPAESSGLVRKLPRWGATSLASVSMGQEISTTSVQLARACSVIANGGMLVKPKLVLRRGEAAVDREPPQRILRPETAITMRHMMEGVVLEKWGTGHKARLEGYTSGGKTGTAQIFDVQTHHYTHLYNASFMGFAPVTNPAVVAVVTLNGTSGSTGYGGWAAAPVFAAVATEALRMLDVPKDVPEEMPAEEQGPEDLNDLSIADLGSTEPNILEESEGLPSNQPIAPMQPAKNETAQAPAQGAPTVLRAPNFQGMSMRAVVEEAAAMGLPVIVDGSGTARGQTPPAGSVLEQGERIRVQFAR